MVVGTMILSVLWGLKMASYSDRGKGRFAGDYSYAFRHGGVSIKTIYRIKYKYLLI